MKNTKLIFAFALMLACAGCATREKVLDASWVSMKYPDPPKKEELQRVGFVSAKYCQTNWSGTYGLIDEVTKLAESQRNVDYIKNASFTKEGETCMTVEGEGFRKKNL